MKLSDCIEKAARELEAADVFYGHGTDNAWDEAAWLVLHAMGVPVNEEADLELQIDSVQQAQIQSLIEQRTRSR